jgi:hypothetical protein
MGIRFRVAMTRGWRDWLATPPEPFELVDSERADTLVLRHRTRSTTGLQLVEAADARELVLPLFAREDDELMAFGLLVQILGSEGRAEVSGQAFGASDLRMVEASVLEGKIKAEMEALLGVIRGADEEVLGVPGAWRPCFLGKQTLRRLMLGKEPMEAHANVLAMMLEIQRADERYYVARSIGVRDADGERTFAAWAPEIATFVPAVEWLAVSLDGGQDWDLPVGALPFLVGSRARQLDGFQWMIEAIPEGERGGLIERARTVRRSGGGKR